MKNINLLNQNCALFSIFFRGHSSTYLETEISANIKDSLVMEWNRLTSILGRLDHYSSEVLSLNSLTLTSITL